MILEKIKKNVISKKCSLISKEIVDYVGFANGNIEMRTAINDIKAIKLYLEISTTKKTM